MADLNQITHTSFLGCRKGCILFLGRSNWNPGCHVNIYVLMEKKIISEILEVTVRICQLVVFHTTS